MKLYRVLTGADDSAFCHRVTEALSKGWDLHGAPAYAHDPVAGGMKVAQAVVKEVSGHEYDPNIKLGDQ